MTLILEERLEEAEPGENAYGLFKEDKTHLGTSIWTSEKYSGEAWFLRKIYILNEFQGQGYGSKLLEKTCEHLWSMKNLPICLQLVSNTPRQNGFELCKWYRKHGFEGPCAKGGYLQRKPK